MALSRINAQSIADGTIVAADIADGSITTAKIADGNVTSAKIDTVANTKLTGTITATQMAANSVNSTILQTNSVENYMATSGRPLSNRNLIINGAMQVAQRNTSVTGITSDGYYTADRWILGLSSAGTWTMNVDSSGPTNTEFRKSANVICTTADSSLAASDVARFLQRIEGQNFQSIKKGTSAAESLTVSFYVKSSNTGTYICEFVDADNARQISKSYTIDAANTWEKKTITVPSDTTGQLDNDNNTSFVLLFWLAAGTDYTSGTLNSSAWASSTNANRVVGQLNLANAVGNYWAVTGIQLETGTAATPFEMRNIAQELALCQRYYIEVGIRNASGSDVFPLQRWGASLLATSFNTPVTMRATPTGTLTSTYSAAGNGTNPSLTAISSVTTVTNTGVAVVYSSSVDPSVTQAYVAIGFGSTSKTALSAEL